MSFIFIVIAMFIIFIGCFIILTKREENMEKAISNETSTKGKLKRVTRKQKLIVNNNMSYIYKAVYTYSVRKRKYSVATEYEIPMNDTTTPIPEEVEVQFDPKRPEISNVVVDLSNTDIKQRPVSHSVVPALIFAILLGIILYNFFVEPLF